MMSSPRWRACTTWPELEKALKDHGVSNYSIFLPPETRQLFGCAEIENEEQWASIASTEACQKWWKHMSDIMPSNPDHSPTLTAASARELCTRARAKPTSTVDLAFSNSITQSRLVTVSFHLSQFARPRCRQIDIIMCDVKVMA
jgi:L-rhamnose mutarotase